MRSPASGRKRYVAFLRGVGPMNARMPELVKAFEGAGFSEVKTVLSSGNVLFSAAAAPVAELERRAEAAMERRLGKAFPAIVRDVEALRRMLGADPYARFSLAPRAKRVVTFLRRKRKAPAALPREVDGTRILGVRGGEVFTAYVPGPRGGAFMALIERTFGRDVTTRTWETVRKVASQADRATGPAPA